MLEVIHVPSNERGKEIKRRRHRKFKYAQLESRIKKGTLSKSDAAEKIRQLSIGGDAVVEAWGLED